MGTEDPFSQIGPASQIEAERGEGQDDKISIEEEQNARERRKARSAAERAENFEEQLILELRERVKFLEGRICLSEILPSRVAKLEQCLDSFRAIGWAQIIVTIVGTLAVGVSGLVTSPTAKWVWYSVGAICLVVTELYRWISQSFALPIDSKSVSLEPQRAGDK